MWRLPLSATHFEQIKSPVADVINGGISAAGASIGAAFIGTFVDDGGGLPELAFVFSGSLEGNGYAIDQLFIDRDTEDYVGLFGVTVGSTLQNLHLRLTSSESNSPLAAFVGETIDGEWQLRVRDLLEDDRGRLDEWTLEIEYEPSEQIVREDREPNRAIPDDDRAGVRDSVRRNQPPKKEDTRWPVSFCFLR